MAARKGRQRVRAITPRQLQLSAGRILRDLDEGRIDRVHITNRDETRAVMISIERYEELAGKEVGEPRYGELRKLMQIHKRLTG
jgi:hypothetical protein